MTEEEMLALQSIQSSYEDLERWRVRSRTPERPERGSELAGDASVWPYFDVAEVARQSLASATQHLNLARVAIEARQLFPVAHFSLLRGGLVGAATAVWVLAPDVAADRQQRALRVVDENYRRALQYHRVLRDHVDLSDPELADWAKGGDHLKRRRGQARAKWTDATGLTANEAMETTAVIKSAATSTFDAREVPAVHLLWRQLSGDAHALTWSVIPRSRMTQRVGGGMAELAAGGDLVELENAFSKVYRLTKRGWSLFDRRCEGS